MLVSASSFSKVYEVIFSIALLELSSHFLIPSWPVCFNLETFALSFILLKYGPLVLNSAALSYLLVCFSFKFMGVSPTFGYLMAYCLYARFFNVFKSAFKFNNLFALYFSNLAVCLFGTIFLSYYMNIALVSAFKLGFLPFLVGEAIKAFSASYFFNKNK